MDLKTLGDIPPWDWPEGTGKRFLEALRDRDSDATDRLVAAELAGDFTVVNDELAHALLFVVRNSKESEELRSKAVISLGPALEQAEIEGFDDPDEVPIAQQTFHTIQEGLGKLYRDAGVPKTVRRRIMEASVRAPQAWHHSAIGAAYSSDDEDWKLTAVFCMRYVRGFDTQIVEGLDSKNPDIRYEAARAAGAWGVDAAWPHLARLVASEETDKDLRLAAIEAVANIRPQDAWEILSPLVDSFDEDVAEAVDEAMTMARVLTEENEFDEDDNDEFPR